jgi:hypothetical protein
VYGARVYEVKNKVGRLVEIRIWSPVSPEEATSWAAEHDAVIAGVGGPYVCVVDLFDAKVFPQAAVDAYTSVMKEEPQLRRTGTLLSHSPTSALQIRRMLRETDNPVRRAFTDVQPLFEWLDPAMTPAERTRLRVCLAENGRI